MWHCSTYSRRTSFPKNRHGNDNLEQQAQALYKSWFIDFEPFRTCRFFDSELGPIPQGWHCIRLGNICKCELGGTPSRIKSEYWNGDIPWINSGEVNKFRITAASEYISQAGLSNSSTKLLPRRTTVLAITGATLGQISILEIDACVNQSVVGILENGSIPMEFIYPLLCHKMDHLVSSQTGGAQQHINKQNVKDLMLILPPMNILQDYRKISSPLFSMISNLCFENEYLKTQRESLLPKLMTGEIETLND